MIHASKILIPTNNQRLAEKVINFLRGEKIPFRVNESGSTRSVYIAITKFFDRDITLRFSDHAVPAGIKTQENRKVDFSVDPISANTASDAIAFIQNCSTRVA